MNEEAVSRWGGGLLRQIKNFNLNKTLFYLSYDIDKEMWLLLSSHKNNVDLDVTYPGNKSDC
jgi:hypothetical protein